MCRAQLTDVITGIVLKELGPQPCFQKAGVFGFDESPPTGLVPGTCYMGVRFYRGLGSANPTVFTSLVQAFDEHGEGGPDFAWVPEQHESKTPHLK